MKSIIATTAILAATVSAKRFDRPGKGEKDAGTVTIVNRCSYPVHLWSINKELGCQAKDRVDLNSGDVYSEAMRQGVGNDDGGISIKISKTETCTLGSLTQLEYKLSTKDKYKGNFLDMSFVDCYGDLDACPGRTDGFYMKAGNQTGGITTSAENNQHCPIFNVANAEEAARVAYVLPNDEQTKWCGMEQNLELYLCGSEAPGDEDVSAPSSPAAPSQIESSSAQSSSSSSKEAASSTSEEANFVVAAAAAITEAPVPAPVAPVIKTEVVYVTEYVQARHAHGRRHKQFHG